MKRFKRKHTGNSKRFSILLDADKYYTIRDLAYTKGISICDWIEQAVDMKLGLEQLVQRVSSKKGSLQVTQVLIHEVSRSRRLPQASDPHNYPGVSKLDPSSRPSSSTFDPEGWYCPNCKRIVTAIQRAMRIRCVRCNSPVQLKRQ